MPVYDVAAKKKRPAGASSNGASEGEVNQHETKTKNKPLSKEKDEGVQESPAVVEFSEPAQWVERMALTSTRSLPADLNADDDPKREEAFIQQALLSVARGLSLLEEANVPWKRPADYYAEMYKSDVQMNRIAEAMESSKARIEARAHRRAMKDQKKYGKEVQAEVLRQRAKYKRDMGERITEWRRKRKGNGELRDILDDNENDNNTGGRAARKERAPQAKNLRPGGGRSAGKRRPGKNARRRQ
ncbi:putative rRNA processing protein [Trypanosoma theileri]|uniref:Putative rRNA processing protein n=1 Tax=Trypanosoma theileri TaxID=67003 RepID=A0A1X0P5U9_9TRYP|nr:putative rRNA processing protein [Trypanosoma theileri]ORC92316.1 putative rRNA processing protein [Trypanosoma theileri]